MAKSTKSTNDGVWYALGVTRILIGLVFLWAFFDKLLGLGYATPASKAWLAGGSPTTGFLKGVEGPFAEFFGALAGQPLIDWIFMLGLLGIGIGLTLGIAVRISVVAGSAMLIMMWMASLPIATNPVIDDHIIYTAVLVAIGAGVSSQRMSLTRVWKRIPLVQKSRWFV